MKGELNGYKIEIPDPPVVDGWEAVEFRHPVEGEWFVTSSGSLVSGTAFCVGANWIMRRKPRRRIVFEECGEPSYYNGNGCMVAPYLMPDGVQISHIRQSAWHDPKITCWLRRTDEEVGG